MSRMWEFCVLWCQPECSKNHYLFPRDRWHVVDKPFSDSSMLRCDGRVMSSVSAPSQWGDRGSSVTRERPFCAVTQMNTAVVGEKVSGFCWYSAAVRFLAGHLTAQRALELEMMLLPPARRRWLPCHTAYAGRHKSYSVNKDPPRSTTSHSFCVLIFFVNAVLSHSLFPLPPSHFSFLCLLLTISFWLFLFPSSFFFFFSSDVVVNKKGGWAMTLCDTFEAASSGVNWNFRQTLICFHHKSPLLDRLVFFACLSFTFSCLWSLLFLGHYVKHYPIFIWLCGSNVCGRLLWKRKGR